MSKFKPLVFFMLLLLCAFSASCERNAPESSTPTRASAPAASVDAGRLLKQSATIDANIPLKLELEAEFLAPESRLPVFDPGSAATASSARFKSVASEPRVQVSGKLYTNLNVENYLRSVDGGEISLEARFE